MSSFPWGQLALILLALDILLTGIFLIRKRLLKRLCQKTLAKGNPQEVARLMHMAEEQHLLKRKEYFAWLEEFGLEDE